MKLLRKIIKAWYFPWLIIGVILRLFISAITAHPDLWALFFAQHLFVFKGVLNIYDHLANLPKTADLVVHYGTNFFTYPPLAFFLFGFFGLILKPFLSFQNFSWIVADYPQIYQNLEIYKTLLLFKLPYLFFDLAIAFLLAGFFDDPKKKKWAFLSWIFNPLSFYTSFKVRLENLWWYFLAVMLLFFSVTHYHPQWFLWLIPFLIYEMVQSKFAHRWLHLALFLSWFFITLAFEPSLNFGLFVPLRPDLINLPGLFEGVGFFDIFQQKVLSEVFLPPVH